ncbi:MAG: DNA-directed RNA polymerase subunit alpha [Chitinispirillales bacterium]|jgi:DNA-directed RNA polymerase subunit alpha|nr:DNA-directed RNA polymerase subunit alpha [Chitinispirillales bacterium]
MKWKTLLMPKGVQVENPDNVPNYSRIIVAPLERGWGDTLGNSLRRVMLSSLQGAAVTAIKIDGALHEYTSLKGVSEDVTDIVLNVKKLRVKLISDEPEILTLNLKGKGVVKASDINQNPNVLILNPDLKIATINEEANSKITFYIGDGIGYRSSEFNKIDTGDVSVIAVDSIFSPVKMVNYTVERTRVAQRAELDKLVFDIWTDGSLTPEEALSYAAKILFDHLDQIINVKAQFESLEEDIIDDKIMRLRHLLRQRIDEFELSVRAQNSMKMANIQTLSDLVRYQESEVLKLKNFGRKSLIEVNKVLANHALAFGMDVDKIMGKE